MDFKNYIGYKLSEVKPLLDSENISYEIVEAWDAKKTKIGNELRIINITDGEKIVIYAAYF